MIRLRIYFWALMVLIDEKVNHPLHELLFEKSEWYSEKIMFNFCTWAWGHWAMLDMEIEKDG